MQFRDFLSSLHAAVVIVWCSVHDTAVVIACAVSTPLLHARAAPASTSLPEAADGMLVRAMRCACVAKLLPEAADRMLLM